LDGVGQDTRIAWDKMLDGVRQEVGGARSWRGKKLEGQEVGGARSWRGKKLEGQEVGKVRSKKLESRAPRYWNRAKMLERRTPTYWNGVLQDASALQDVKRVKAYSFSSMHLYYATSDQYF
jgi:hypothetical protein